jgi:hypothetical protein
MKTVAPTSWTASVLAFVLVQAGCASLSINPRLVGTYSGTNAEALIFMSDARVFHTQIVDAKQQRFFLGYYVTRSSVPNELLFAGPDTSPFLGTSFLVSDDFLTVTANWNNRRRPQDSWQITYRNNAKLN